MCVVTCCRAEKEIAIVNIKHNQFKQKKKLQQQAFLFSVMKKIKNALLNEKLMAIYCHSGHRQEHMRNKNNKKYCLW